MRRVIIHMHMPKTGGTTLDSALERSFGQGHRNISYLVRKGEHGRPAGCMTWDEVARARDASAMDAVWSLSTPDVMEILDADKGIVSMSRHGLYVDPGCVRKYPGCPDACRGYDMRPIFFVREFFSWHTSLYFQQRGDPARLSRYSRDPRAVLAKTGSLKEYTRFCVDNADALGNHKIMHNWTDAETRAVMDGLDLYQIGLTERYDESLVVAEDALSADFPGIDLSYPRPLNVSRARRGEDGDGAPPGRAYLERKVGGGLLGELEDAYAERWVYDRMSSELELRMSRVRDFQEKLDGFRARCARRRANGASTALPAPRRTFWGGGGGR